MKKLVVSEPLHPAGCDMLAARNDIQTVYTEGDADALAAEIVDAHGILIRTLFLPEALLKTAPNLQVVSRHGVGCDNIAVDYLSSRGIPVAIAVNSNTTSVVEHVMMMMLTLNKRARQFDDYTRNHQFGERSRHHTSELCGKHVLIVGFGRIGKRLAPVCRAFGMRVTVADIVLDEQYADALGCTGVEDFRPHLPFADYLSVHVPLSESTRHLIGAAELAALPEHAIVINCARGGIIDEAALAAEIRAGTLAATGSDVFETEPPAADNPLLSLPNSILTPHNAAGTAESLERMACYSAQNALDGIDGKLNPDMLINRDALMR